MFIPEIGFEFSLSKEWNFKLVLEHRNNKLVEIFYPDYNVSYSYRNNYIESLGFNGQCLQSKKISSIIDELYTKDMSMLDLNQAKEKSIKIFEENISELLPEENLEPITFPIGTILKVDRIYIRKGAGMSEYSSLSFYATLPGQKKKFRFFAKLNDVNTIEFND